METNKPTKLEKLLNQVFITIEGKRTIPQLIKSLGKPKAVLEYAKIEAKTGSTVNPTTVIERFVDGKLVFRKDVVINGITKDLLLKMDYSGIETVYVRHPTYNPLILPKATKSELQNNYHS